MGTCESINCADNNFIKLHTTGIILLMKRDPKTGV